jgi:hypothetical protein
MENTMVQRHTNVVRRAWSGGAEGLLEQVRQLTFQLQSIKCHLLSELAEGHGIIGKLSNNMSSDRVSEFQALKAVADEIRHLLWVSLQNASSDDNAPALQDRSCQSQQCASQPRPLLVPETTPPLTRLEAGSFFERLHLVIDGYMQNRGIAFGEKRRKY